MRLNAPIVALLVCVCLLPGHAAFAAVARSTHHSASHKTASKSSTQKRAQSKATAVKATSTTRPARSKAVASTSKKHVSLKQVHASATSRRKASSEDFVRAAKTTTRHSRSSARQLAAEDVHADSQSPVAEVQEPTESIELAATHASEDLATPVILPTLYNKRGRLIVPPPLKGSHEILVHQNLVADRDGLDRIQDDNDLERMRLQRLLIGIPESKTLAVDDRLPSNRRYCRPWTAQFLATLAHAHYARFHKPLQVNSAVRTVEFQQHLIHVNGNAAPAEGETASPHLTGQAIDIAKHGLSLTEIAWLRGYLLPLIQQGRIDVEEEFQQACFHISVYKRYTPSHEAPRRSIAASHHSGTSALAAAIQ